MKKLKNNAPSIDKIERWRRIKAHLKLKNSSWGSRCTYSSPPPKYHLRNYWIVYTLSKGYGNCVVIQLGALINLPNRNHKAIDGHIGGENQNWGWHGLKTTWREGVPTPLHSAPPAFPLNIFTLIVLQARNDPLEGNSDNPSLISEVSLQQGRYHFHMNYW